MDDLIGPIIIFFLIVFVWPISCGIHGCGTVERERIHPKDIRWAESVCRENGGVRYITHGGEGVTCVATVLTGKSSVMNV